MKTKQEAGSITEGNKSGSINVNVNGNGNCCKMNHRR